MNKLVTSGNDAMSKIKEGVELVANPVATTLGAMGRTVIIAQSYLENYTISSYPVLVTKDGYNVARSISSSTPEIQVGVRLIQEAAEKQHEDVGDGTTTTCILTKEILNGGLALIESGHNHVSVKNGILAAVDYVVSELKKQSTNIDEDSEMIKKVATVSANGDTEIGNLIAEAFKKIGGAGVINIEESNTFETSIRVSDGLKFSKSYISPFFITNKAKSEAVLEKPYILIYDRPIVNLKEFMPLLIKIIEKEKLTNTKRPLMVFAEDINGEALATLTYNTVQGLLQSCAVEMRFLGERKHDFMEDIAIATGGTFISELKGVKLENISLEHLGQAEKIVVSKDDTVIINGLKNEADFNAHISNIKELEKEEKDDAEKELLRKRIARLTGSVAILSVGGTTEVEMREKKDRVDDAVRATRSAVEEGFVVGGGISFLRISAPDIILEELYAGFNVVFRAISKPLKQIIENAGQPIDEVFANVEKQEGNVGYNAKKNVIEDLVKAGIIEPTKSNRCALQNAASVACAILTSKFMITDTM